MTNKLPTVDIKGKEYVLVKDRIIAFNETFKMGSISTELLSPYDSDLIVIKATVRPDSSETRLFTGHSQARVGDGYINKTSALENAETSAVGRALAMMGIGVIDSIASVDEINKTTHYNKNTITTSGTVDKFMEDLQPSQEDLIAYSEKLESAKTLKELKAFFLAMPPLIQNALNKKKDELKLVLGTKNSDGSDMPDFNKK